MSWRRDVLRSPRTQLQAGQLAAKTPRAGRVDRRRAAGLDVPGGRRTGGPGQADDGYRHQHHSGVGGPVFHAQAPKQVPWTTIGLVFFVVALVWRLPCACPAPARRRPLGRWLRLATARAPTRLPTRSVGSRVLSGRPARPQRRSATRAANRAAIYPPVPAWWRLGSADRRVVVPGAVCMGYVKDQDHLVVYGVQDLVRAGA